MRAISLALATAAILGAAPTSPSADSPDPVLARLAAADPARTTRALVRLAPGQALPAGVTATSRAGDVLAVTGPAAALAAIGGRAEAARTCRFRTDVAGTSTIAFRGDIASGAEVDSYSFAGVAGQSVRVRVHPEGALNPFVSVTDAAPVTDDDSGPGAAAQLDVTWTTTGTKTIDVSSSGAATTGAYLLYITATTPVVPGDLTGGDIGASTPHIAGTRAREARAIEGLDGTGVLVGFVDSGIDFTHADFRSASGATRLVGIWDQTLTANAGERVPSAGYGVHWKEDEILAPGVCRQEDTVGHGSIVAAVATGDDSIFTGAAPNARLFMVKFDGTTTGAIDGINLILDEAERLEFDAVVINLSIGTHDGPHDGTSLFDQAVTGAVSRARHIVCAAGNESDPTSSTIHAQSVVGTSVAWTYTPAALGSHAVDIWCDGADTYTVTVSDLLATTTATATSGTTATAGPTTSATSLTIDNRVDTPSNGATHIRVEIADLLFPQPWTITLAKNGSSTGSGLADGYIATEDGTFLPGVDITLNADGSVPGCIVEPATSTGAIAVGAYRGKFAWDTPSSTTAKTDGTGAGVAGNIALFSSRGPTRDGRAKPEISAPGAYVAGARSTNSSPAAADIDADGVHVHGAGTSFATPQVAGIVALLLQKNRLQTNDEVKALLASTALADGFTSVGSTWGAGKVNATALLAAVITQRDIRAKAGGCGSSAGADTGGWVPLACLAASLALLSLRRLRC
jgi:hypothetical protein